MDDCHSIFKLSACQTHEDECAMASPRCQSLTCTSSHTFTQFFSRQSTPENPQVHHCVPSKTETKREYFSVKAAWFSAHQTTHRCPRYDSTPKIPYALFNIHFCTLKML